MRLAKQGTLTPPGQLVPPLACYASVDATFGTLLFNNRILHNGECKACPDGLNGQNCTSTCPYGYHGSACDFACNCSEDQFCHPGFGCGYLSVDGTFGNSSEAEACVSPLKEDKIWGFNINQWFIISMVLLGFIILVLIFTCCVCLGQNICKKEEYKPTQIVDLLTRIAENGTLPRQQGQDERNRNHYALQDFSYGNEYQPEPQFTENRFSPGPSTSFGESDMPESAYAEPDMNSRKTCLKPMLSTASAASAFGEERYDSMTRQIRNCVVGYDRCGLRNNVDVHVSAATGNTRRKRLSMEPLKQLGNRISRFMTDTYNEHFRKDYGENQSNDSFPDPPSAGSMADIQQDNTAMDTNAYFILESSAVNAPMDYDQQGQNNGYDMAYREEQIVSDPSVYNDIRDTEGEFEGEKFIQRNKFSSFKGKSY